MSRIASEALIERLADWGVDTVFGIPGDGINGIMDRHAGDLGARHRLPAGRQAKKFAQAFLRGQPHRATIATTLFRDKIEQLKG